MAYSSKTLDLIMKVNGSKFRTFEQFFKTNAPPILFNQTPNTKMKVSRSYSNKSENTRRKSISMIEFKEVKIFARMKPCLEEQNYKILDNSIFIDNQIFTFDQVFQECTQQQVYDCIAQQTIIDGLNGINGTIIAYGQTGSGKTYTMLGTKQDEGLVIRSIQQVLKSNQQIYLSILEIYKDYIYDLLGNMEDLKLKEDPNQGFYVDRLQRIEIKNEDECRELLRIAEINRHMAETKLNAQSSRSHLILTIYIGKKTKINLVDLAGSEKVSKTGASGETLQEAKKINYSLSCLGHVIQCLAQGQDHIPYRDSKLTKLLQDSLQGDCRTSIIVNCSPNIINKEETISSLKFAQRARYLKFQQKTQKKSYRDLENEIIKLREELDAKNNSQIISQVSNFQTTSYTVESELPESIRMTHRSVGNSYDCSSRLPNLEDQVESNIYDVQSKISYVLADFSVFMKQLQLNPSQQQYQNKLVQELQDLNQSFQGLTGSLRLQIKNNQVQNKFVESQKELNKNLIKLQENLDPQKLSFQFSVQSQLQNIEKQLKENLNDYQHQLDKIHKDIAKKDSRKTSQNKLKLVISPQRKENADPQFKRQVSASYKYLKNSLLLSIITTILKYIVRTHNLHQFFPQDSKQQALVEAYLDWHHTGTREITLFLRAFVWGPYFMKYPVPENRDEKLKQLEEILTFIEKIFLGEGKFQFIQNQPTLSIADLSLVNELVGLFSMNYDFNQHPIIKKYVEHLLSVPEIRETNKDYFGFIGHFKFAEYNDFIKQYV